MGADELLHACRIERVGTVDQVVARLRELIATGRLPQGERLREIPLAQALSVSRNTVRDAIRVLVGEGLVVNELHRGASVRVLSQDDIRDIYRVRKVLEREGLRYTADADITGRRRTEEALAACDAAAGADDYPAFVEAELEFHAALVAQLGSPRLDRTLTNVLSELRLALSVLADDADPAIAKRIARRYRQLYTAAARGDLAKAEALLADHLDAYERRLLGGLGLAHPAGARHVSA